MEDDERRKKLQAGRDRLAKFQKKKSSSEKRPKKKKKKADSVEQKPPSDSLRDCGSNGRLEDIDRSKARHSDDESSVDVGDFSIASSDLINSCHGDLISPVSFDSDQQSFATDDLCADSDTSGLDADVARIELQDARRRIDHLEESLLGKQTALDQMQKENEAYNEQHVQNPDHNGLAGDQDQSILAKRESDYQAAIEQYNLKIGEFQQALHVRDDIIRQISSNLHERTQERDAIQDQMVGVQDKMNNLQAQLSQAGKSLKNQNGSPKSLTEELSRTQNEVIAMQQTMTDKDNMMQTLAQRYSQKTQELADSLEAQEDIRRRSAEQILTLHQTLKDNKIDPDSSGSGDDGLARLQAELDESYGNQIVMIKEQLQDRHQQEKYILQQKVKDLERHVSANADTNKLVEDLECQISDLKNELSKKETINKRNEKELAEIKEKLALTVYDYEQHLENMRSDNAEELEAQRKQQEHQLKEKIHDLEEQHKFKTQYLEEQFKVNLDDLTDQNKLKLAELETQLNESRRDYCASQDAHGNEIATLKAEIAEYEADVNKTAAIKNDYKDQIAKLKTDQEEAICYLNSNVESLVKENDSLKSEKMDNEKEIDKLGTDLEEFKLKNVGRDAGVVDINELRQQIEKELKEEFDERIDDLTYAHERDQTRLEGSLAIDYQDDLKESKQELDNQYAQKVESLQAEKEKEFIAQLQKLRQEMQEANAKEIAENLNEERKKLEQQMASVDDVNNHSELLKQLQGENQDLSEARDALLHQIRQNEAAYQEEKDNLMGENERLNQELEYIKSIQLGDQHNKIQPTLDKPVNAYDDVFEDNVSSEGEHSRIVIEVELDKIKSELQESEEQRVAFEEEVSQLKQDHRETIDRLEDEKAKISDILDTTRKDLEESPNPIDNKDAENEGLKLKEERLRLLGEKENLQQKLEEQEKDNESKLGEIKTKMSALKTRIEEVEEERQILEEERDTLSSQVDALEDYRNKNKVELEKAQSHVLDLQDAISDMESLKKNAADLEEQLVEHTNVFQQQEEHLNGKILDLQQQLLNSDADRQAIEPVELECENLKKELATQGENYEAQIESLKSSLQEQLPDASDESLELERLQLEHNLLKNNIEIKNAEIAALQEQIKISEYAVGELKEVKQETDTLRQKLQKEKQERWQVEETIPLLQAKVENLEQVDNELSKENDELHKQVSELRNENSAKRRGDQEELEALQKEVKSLQKGLKETEVIYARENKLLKAALDQENISSSNMEDSSYHSNDSQDYIDLLQQEVLDLKQKLARKEQTEHEILTEKTRQISILQESNANLEREKEDFRTKVNDLEKQLKMSDSVSDDVQDVFAQQLTKLQDQQSNLQEQLDEQRMQRGNLSGILDDSVVREDALRQEKEVLLKKLQDKEDLERKLMQEKIELQKRIHEQDKLEGLLHEKDRLEQELSRQKRLLESELHDIEQHLQERENQLIYEKSVLEKDLREKDIQLRKWEISLREQQLEFRNRQSFMTKRHTEEITSFKADAEQDKLTRLEKMRAEKDREHAEAIARLRHDLQMEFSTRESRTTEKHLLGISLLKTKHQSQLENLRADMEASMEVLRKELDEERQRQVGLVKAVHEREHGREVEKLKDHHIWEIEAQREELDAQHQELFDEMKTKMEAAYQEELENARRQIQDNSRADLEATKAAVEQVYASQVETLRAKYDHGKANALAELREELLELHREENERTDQQLKETLARMEDTHKADMHSKMDEGESTTQELIGQLQCRLNNEHKAVIENLAQDFDQKVLNQLEVLRTEMEDKHKARMEVERRKVLDVRESEITEKTEEYQSDVEVLLKERELVLQQAEAMRQNLEKVHQEELSQLRGTLQAEYDQLAKIRQDLEAARSQTETSLKAELKDIRDAYADLQNKYDSEKDRNMGSSGNQDQELEIKQLQEALTKQRAKLQQENAHELEQLRTYFEERVATNEEQWSHEMSHRKTHHGSPDLKSTDDEDSYHLPPRTNLPHSMMTLTHLSDVDSSPPLSPPKFVETSTDIKQQLKLELRSQIEQEFEDRLHNLRDELESENKGEIERLKLQFELQHDTDIKKVKDEINLRHQLQIADLTANHIGSIDELKEALNEDSTREITQLRLRCAAETAQQVQEESEKLIQDHQEELSRMKEDLEHSHKGEIQNMKLVFDMQQVGEVKRETAELENQHRIEMEKLRADIEAEKQKILEQAEENVAEEVARVLSEVTLDTARDEENLRRERESERQQLENSKKDVEELQMQLNNCEDRFERIKKGLQEEYEKEKEFSCMQMEEKHAHEISNLRMQLEDTQQKLTELKERVENGEAPEVATLKESLMRQYNSQLEMFKATMTEEIEALTNTQQQLAGQDLEELQARFVQEHQQMIGKFTEDQELAMSDLKKEHEDELEHLKKELEDTHEKEQALIQESLQKDQAHELKELRDALEADHQKYMDVLITQNEEEILKVKAEMAEKLQEEKDTMEERLKEEMKSIENASDLMDAMKSRYEEEKTQLKDDLVAAHMEKFRQVTDELEAEHRQELDTVRDTIQAVLERKYTDQIEELQNQIEMHESNIKELQDKHSVELKELYEKHMQELDQVKTEYEDKLQAVAMDTEKELDTTKLDLEVAHQQEMKNIQSANLTQREKDRELLEKQQEEAVAALKEEHKADIERLLKEHEEALETLIKEEDVTRRLALEEQTEKQRAEIEEALVQLQEQLLADADRQKEEVDTMLKEKEQQYQREAEQLTTEVNKLQQKNMALVQQVTQYNTVMSRREREDEESGNLLAMLQADVQRLNGNRSSLQRSNDHLLQVLSRTVRVSIATEDSINKHLSRLAASTTRPAGEGSSDDKDVDPAIGQGGDGGDNEQQLQGAVRGGALSGTGRPNQPEQPSPIAGDGLHDTSLMSAWSDEGLELSQHLSDSVFAGPDLDADGEELVSGVNTRLQAAVERLLEMVSAATEQIQQARASHQRLLSTAAENVPESIDELQAERVAIMAKLKTEVEAKEDLMVEVHKMHGLLEGLEAEKQELEEAIANSEVSRHDLAIDLNTTQERLDALENKQKNLQAEREQIEQQKVIIAEKLGADDIGLLEETVRLQQCIDAIREEKLGIETQASKSKERLESQIHNLESAVEEQISKSEKLSEERKMEIEDLRNQIETAEKQHKKNKQFLDQQAIDREQEREEFQREIHRLEEELKARDKTPANVEHLHKEMQELREELKEKEESITQAANKLLQLEREITWKEDTTQELTSQVKHLERQLESRAELEQELTSKITELEKEVATLRELEDETTHEKEALQQQLYDNLMQLSAVQSKMDAIKQGVEGTSGAGVGKDGSVANMQSEVSLVKQLEEDKEALERKDEEIQDLVDQLEQFREEIINKEEDISQLQLQLEVASREQDSGRENFEELLKDALQENAKLKERQSSLQTEMQGLANRELNQELLDEKNRDIEDLTKHIEDIQRQCDSLKAQLAVKDAQVEELQQEQRPLEPAVGQEEEQVQELDNLKSEYESRLRSLESELNELREALEEERGRNVLEDPDVTDALSQMNRDHEQDKSTLEIEVTVAKQMLGVREREVAQLEAQLVLLRQQTSDGLGENENQITDLANQVQDKDAQIIQLKLRVDDLEENIFQTQQLVDQTPASSALAETETTPSEGSIGQLQHEHELRIAEMKQEHAETLATLRERHNAELAHLNEKHETDLEQLSELESSYDQRLANLQGLSPGKTLQQKLHEIKQELTEQHQVHIRDIQRNMERESSLLKEQLKEGHAQQVQAMEERHQHEVEEAVLRVNRDLLAAHAEEMAKIQDEHGKQLEMLMAGTPSSLSSAGDIANLLSREVETTARLDSNLLGHLKTRQAGVGKERGPIEGASTESDHGDIPSRLQIVLNRLHNEGLQVLSLSDLRYLQQQTTPRPTVQDGADLVLLQDSFAREKEALLDAIQALKDLVTQATAGHRANKDDESDWRGDLLRAIQCIFERERETLLAELRTHVMATGDKDLSEVQLLERRIREQESHHKSAMEQVYSADRASLLAEIRDLRAHNSILQLDLQDDRQTLVQQLSNLEEQGTRKEKLLKRQLETMEHKFRQERILVDDLRTSLTVEQEKVSQLADALNREKGISADLRDEISQLQIKVDRLTNANDRLDSRIADVTNALESEKVRSSNLSEELELERRNSRALQETLEHEDSLNSSARERDQEMTKELRRELEIDRSKVVEMTKTLEKERIKVDNLQRELDAENNQSRNLISSEKAKVGDLKSQLDVERSRCQEMQNALQREQTLSAQLHGSLEQERSAYSENSRYEKTTITDLQAMLDTEKANSLNIRAEVQELKNTVSSLEKALEVERRRALEGVEHERGVARQLKSNLSNAQAKQQDLSRQLAVEQDRVSRLQGERDRLQATLLTQKERERERDIQREEERQNERRVVRDLEKERDVEKQRLRDVEREQHMDKEKVDSLEQRLEDSKQRADRLAEELHCRTPSKQGQDRMSNNNLQQAFETELTRGMLRHSPAGSPGSTAQHQHLYRGQLETIRQRLQLNAIKQQEEVAKLLRAKDGSNQVVQEQVKTIERSLTEILAELKQVHAALTLQTEEQPPLITPTISRLNERLLQQNTELSNLVSQLSSEKGALRGVITKLEEDIWQLRQTQQASRMSPGKQGTMPMASSERTVWVRERLASRNALDEAENQIAQLKIELEAARMEGGRPRVIANGDVADYQHLKQQRLYGKYLRAESFRKALVYQKRYLLLLLGGFQDCEQATLSLIAKMGAYPNPADLQKTSRHGRGYTRFRSAARVLIAVSRLKFLVKKWKRATRMGTTSVTGFSSSSPLNLSPDTHLHSRGSYSSTHRGQSPYSITLPREQQVHSPARGGRGLGLSSHSYTSPPRQTTTGVVNSISSSSPPVRDRAGHASHSSSCSSVSGSSEPRVPSAAVHGRLSRNPGNTPGSLHSSNYTTPLTNGDPEASLTEYIQRLETVQQRLGVYTHRGTSNSAGTSQNPPSYTSYSKR